MKSPARSLSHATSYGSGLKPYIDFFYPRFRKALDKYLFSAFSSEKSSSTCTFHLNWLRSRNKHLCIIFFYFHKPLLLPVDLWLLQFPPIVIIADDRENHLPILSLNPNNVSACPSMDALRFMPNNYIRNNLLNNAVLWFSSVIFPEK